MSSPPLVSAKPVLREGRESSTTAVDQVLLGGTTEPKAISPVVATAIPEVSRAQVAPSQTSQTSQSGSPLGPLVTLEEAGPPNSDSSLEMQLAQKLQQLNPVAALPPPTSGGSHPGVEMHNHLLGVLDTETFIQKAGEGSSHLLLARIDQLFRQSLNLRAEAPDIERLLMDVRRLKDKGPLDPRHVNRILEQLLTATPKTPFDGVYTPRDELIKHFWSIDAKQTRTALERSGLNPSQVQELESRMGLMLPAADQSDLIRIGDLSQEQAAKTHNCLIDQRYESFLSDTMRFLASDGIHYSEQSISLNKLNTRLNPEMLQRVHAQLHSEGIPGDLRFLAMVPTTYLSEAFIQKINPHSGMPAIFEQKGLQISPQQHQRLMEMLDSSGQPLPQVLRQIASASAEQLQQLGLTPAQARSIAGQLPPQIRTDLEGLLRRGDVMGVDIASPEKEPFTPRGMKNFDDLYQLLKAAAQERGRPMVLRPHVGEGYPEMPEGIGGFRRYRAVRDSETQNPTHYDLAELNLEILIGHLEASGYNAEKGAQDGVIVRFGHATHINPQQIRRMKALGIYAEANLSSNVQTGALQREKHGGDALENHPLLGLLYHEVPTLISTDAHGVMHTNLAMEYLKADRLIELFQANKISLCLEDREVYYTQLTPEEQKRFDPSRLRQWAADYAQAVHQADQSDRSR